MESAGDTIAAIATPTGPARRGIVRVSGRDCAGLVRATLRAAEPAFAPELARQHVRGRFEDGRGLVPVQLRWMRAPRSFTREDVAEFHLPGAEPLLRAALARLIALGARAARAGEFTRRAFRNGRLDLSRAEGVLAVTEAGNEAERAAAALLLDGGLERRVAGIRAELLALAALCEASLDFDESETGHVPRDELLTAFSRAEAATAEACSFELERAAPSALPRVFLVGAPNAGKSSLWNALTGGRALVSAEAGTTRDALEGLWLLDEGACLLVDGPGIEAVARGPGAKAQALFEQRRGAADLVVWVVDGSVPGERESIPDTALVALAKADLPRVRSGTLGRALFALSSRTGEGLAALARGVSEALTGGGTPGATGAATLAFARHQEALRRARAALSEVGALLRGGAPLDLVAEAVRAALSALDELSGRTTPEEVLDQIFARFCLGK